MNKKNQGGLNQDRLAHLKSVIEADIQSGLYYGGVIAIGRHGVLEFYESFGHADPDGKRPVQKDSVFSLFSTTKAFTNILVFRAIELGQFALTTKVSEVIPEFSGGQRQHITVFSLITHSSGLPSVYTPKPGMYIDRLDEIIAAICEVVQPEAKPGERVDYSPLVSHALLGEMVRRTDPKGRSYRQLVEDEILKPLELKDTAVGLRADLRERHLFPEFGANAPIDHLGHSDLGPNGAFLEEHAEMPWVGIVSTAMDMYRLAEMMRRGGELDGNRILSPRILQLARRNWTGDKPNEVYRKLANTRGWAVVPGYIGLGFILRGEIMGHNLFGHLTSPETFGSYGAGTTILWVDPVLDMTFVGLCTKVLERGENIERWSRYSDIAVSAAS